MVERTTKRTCHVSPSPLTQRPHSGPTLVPRFTPESLNSVRDRPKTMVFAQLAHWVKQIDRDIAQMKSGLASSDTASSIVASSFGSESRARLRLAIGAPPDSILMVSKKPFQAFTVDNSEGRAGNVRVRIFGPSTLPETAREGFDDAMVRGGIIYYTQASALEGHKIL